MANETHEPRALSAALSAPTPFATRGGGSMLHAANRHVERWAPETTAANVRSMRSLGFVDRLVAPWIETAQRSASMRLFSQYSTAGAAQREGAAVSWVFPRPWYQDELDWMAAARQVKATAGEGESAPTMFTTRGTFVAPQPPPQPQRPAIAAPQTAMPSALYEYVAPSLSIAQPTPQSSIAGIGHAGADSGRPLDAYSTLIPLAAVQAAELMSRAVAPLMRAPTSPDGAIATPSTMGRVSPALRAVLTTMLERATTQRTDARVAQQAPELVTPPAPRPEPAAQPAPLESSSPASRLADHYAGQRAQIADLQRIARVSAERELSLRDDAQANEASIAASVAASATARSDQQAKTEIQHTVANTDAQRAAAAANEAQRVAAMTEAQRAAAAERARIEERIAQRSSERAGADQARAGQQRLHEQARTEAAQHARMADLAASTPAPTTPTAVDPRPAPPPAEVLAAIAALPLELQQILAQRPERGMAAIAELGEVLRAAELMARSTHVNQPFEVTRGPRLMMPAGLGGLVSAVDRAHVIADRPAQLSSQFSSTMAAPSRLGTMAPRSAQIVQRMPTLPWLTGPAASTGTGGAPSTALGATSAAQPAALAHVAWSDRWLARFAGAAPRSLEILQASAGGSHDQRMAALASAAPESVFVRPMFDAMPRAAMPIEAVPSFGTAPAIASASQAPTPVLRPSPQPIERFDDNAETPDDVFAQIAAAAAGVRTAAATQASVATTASAASSAAPAVATVPTVFDARMTQADSVAHAAPSAPNAGLSAGLAASPFAPALRHLLPLPAAASFDVRALFGAGLSATYLAGLLTADAQPIGVESTGIGAPAWAMFAPAGTQAAESVGLVNERSAPELDLTYVSPEPAAARDDVRSSADETSQVEPRAAEQAAVLASSAAPLTTLRTALLSWNVDLASPSLAEAPTVTAGQTIPATSSAARIMSESMSMPMLGDALPDLDGGSAWTAPGMVGERAQSWSIAQERSSSDLSLDFVAPELVLAARVYGLGPAEAAQASRLALAGPGQLSAMASTVDRTFVQAMSIASDRRAGQLGGPTAATAMGAAPGPGAIATAYPIAPPASAGTIESDRAAGVGPAQIDHVLPTTAFGVERRTPRGAFLWPSASVAALGLNAAAHDGGQSMSVAALELLAAQAVAEIGTYAAFADRDVAGAAFAADDLRTRGADGADGATRETHTLPVVGGAAAPSLGGNAGMPSLAEPAEADVLGAAAALVSTSRRARFDALYVALSQSPSGRNWSPAARAARALALAGRGDETPVSAYERAATAWDVLPVVYATDGMSIAEIDAATATGTLPRIARSAAAARGGRAGSPEMPSIASSGGRRGMTPLTSRAGEALGSYVAPSTGEMATAVMRSDSFAARATSRELPIAQRAPSAAQELVQTGRPAGRHGGGEVEIPAWFESAARKMFDDRSSAGSSDMGISMSELTLISAAPPAQIAASTKAPHAASVAPAPSGGKDKAQSGGAIDIDKIANDVYREIMAMMDMARSRNGEPYL